jgi:hypothetical protein
MYIKMPRTRRIIEKYYDSKTLEDYDNLKVEQRDWMKTTKSITKRNKKILSADDRDFLEKKMGSIKNTTYVYPKSANKNRKKHAFIKNMLSEDNNQIKRSEINLYNTGKMSGRQSQKMFEKHGDFSNSSDDFLPKSKKGGKKRKIKKKSKNKTRKR